MNLPWNRAINHHGLRLFRLGDSEAVNFVRISPKTISSPIAISPVFAAEIKQLPRSRVNKKREVSAGSNACAAKDKYTQSNTHKHKQPNGFSRKEMIRDHVKNGFFDRALRLYYEMQRDGIKPDKSVLIYVINACGSLSDLQAGRKIHEYVLATRFKSDVFVGTALASMYVKCGSLEIARQVFDRMPKRDVVSWNVLIAGYCQNDHPHEALAVFNEMLAEGIKPNSISLISVLPACVDLLALEQGKQIHACLIRRGSESHVVVGSGLVDMYAKCGNVNIAGKLFERMPEKNVVSWNTIIAGYCQNGYAHAALTFFAEMQVQGIKPDSTSVSNVLPACANLLALQQGKQIHCYLIKNGLESDVIVGTALVDMYAKCSNINIARKLFERMPQRNVVSWNTIIAGYSQNGHPHEALTSVIDMQVHNTKPNAITVVSALPVCADLLALEQGKQIHGYVIRSGFESDFVVGSGLVDMYAKCGHIDIARQVFDKMPTRNVVAWNTMILGYGIHGHGKVALALFSQMQQTGTKPDHITFIGILTACSHAGLIDEGWQYFKCMKSDYGLEPKLEHYACLVDLLGRAGHLDEAHDIIKKMPLKPDSVMWGTLLGACKIHSNIELGEQAAKHLFQLEPNNAGYYLLLSNIYAKAGRWEDVAKLRTIMREKEVKKQPGYSFIEVNREVHTFLVGDRSHPQSEKIYAVLETLYGKMKEAGYVPNTNFVLQDVEENRKEEMLCNHSEKVAIAFGVMKTSPGTPSVS
eukprot:PITA_13972